MMESIVSQVSTLRINEQGYEEMRVTNIDMAAPV